MLRNCFVFGKELIGKYVNLPIMCAKAHTEKSKARCHILENRLFTKQ